MGQTVPDLIIAMAPYMERLKMLEEEVVKLRLAKYPGTKPIKELLAKAGWKLEQSSHDGLWRVTIPIHRCSTGRRSGEWTRASFYRCCVSGWRA